MTKKFISKEIRICESCDGKGFASKQTAECKECEGSGRIKVTVTTEYEPYTCG